MGRKESNQANKKKQALALFQMLTTAPLNPPPTPTINVQCINKYFFLFFNDKGIDDPNTAINGPPSARQRNAFEIAFRWWADNGPTLNAGLVAL